MKAHEYAKFFTANSEIGKKFLALAEQESEAEVIIYCVEQDDYSSASDKFLILNGNGDFKVENFVKITEIFQERYRRINYIRLEEYKLRPAVQYDPAKFSVQQIKAIVVGMV